MAPLAIARKDLAPTCRSPTGSTRSVAVERRRALASPSVSRATTALAAFGRHARLVNTLTPLVTPSAPRAVRPVITAPLARRRRRRTCAVPAATLPTTTARLATRLGWWWMQGTTAHQSRTQRTSGRLSRLVLASTSAPTASAPPSSSGTPTARVPTPPPSRLRRKLVTRTSPSSAPHQTRARACRTRLNRCCLHGVSRAMLALGSHSRPVASLQSRTPLTWKSAPRSTSPSRWPPAVNRVCHLRATCH